MRDKRSSILDQNIAEIYHEIFSTRIWRYFKDLVYLVCFELLKAIRNALAFVAGVAFLLMFSFVLIFNTESTLNLDKFIHNSVINIGGLSLNVVKLIDVFTGISIGTGIFLIYIGIFFVLLAFIVSTKQKEKLVNITKIAASGLAYFLLLAGAYAIVTFGLSWSSPQPQNQPTVECSNSTTEINQGIPPCTIPYNDMNSNRNNQGGVSSQPPITNNLPMDPNQTPPLPIK